MVFSNDLKMQILYVSLLILIYFQAAKSAICIDENFTPTDPSVDDCDCRNSKKSSECCSCVGTNTTSTTTTPSPTPSYVRKSLIFVYDVINPGVHYNEFVQGIGKIYNDLFQPGPQQIFNKLLVVFPSQTSVEIYTFNDTNSATMVETLLNIKSTIEQEKTLKDVSRVLTGLWKGLYHGDPKSIIYVFTNAKPEDKSIMTGITCAIENKMIEVGFVIEQKYPERGIPEEYQTISIRGNGIIFNVHRNYQVMNFFSILLTSTKNKVNLMTINNAPNKQHGIIFDKYLDEITVADFTFEGVYKYITNHYYYSEGRDMITSISEVQTIRHFCTLKTKVESFKHILQNYSFVNVDTNSLSYGLRVFGVSGLNFEYEFSVDIKENCNCTNSTLKRPIMDVLNYVRVKATNEEYDAIFKSCKIIAIDNSFSKEITLQKITSSEHDVYYGSFVPNSQAFYLQVTADINGEIVQRMSPFAISAFTLPPSQNKQNEVEISAGYRNKNYYSKETGQMIRFK